MSNVKHTDSLGKEHVIEQVALGGAEASDNSQAGGLVLKDGVTQKITYIEKIGGIGHAAGTAVELDLTGLQKTRYRFKPSADMRVAEDAVNVTQAEDWLQVGVLIGSVPVGPINFQGPVAADEWSEWRYFSEGNYLTNLWFSLDAAGTGATAIVETE